MTMELAKKHPHLQLKLQDMPDRMVQARDTIWPEQCPEAIKENRIEFKAVNFLTESPIPECDVYYVCFAFYYRLKRPSDQFTLS
jgi:hypothetical protein